jgi:hypothetical protein
LQRSDRYSLAPPDRQLREQELRTINQEPYDRAKWKALVEYDPDISRVVSALSPYGQKYVDQLATGYLALNDKNYLPMIVQKFSILLNLMPSATRDVFIGKGARHKSHFGGACFRPSNF